MQSFRGPTTVGGNADMFSIMRLMLQLNHLRSMDVMEVQPRRILELATIDGAKDLGIADRVGSLTPGKRADLILVRTNDLNVAPFVNPALLLAQQAQPYNVDPWSSTGAFSSTKASLPRWTRRKLFAKPPNHFMPRANAPAARIKARAKLNDLWL
jgi:5-methylthioadenosine/S-adenosylhomocysteine deaminase